MTRFVKKSSSSTEENVSTSTTDKVNKFLPSDQADNGDSFVAIASIYKQIEEVKQELTKAKNQADKTSDQIKKIQKEQEKGKTHTIEALAVFVALFTFVSTNITIFSKIEYLSAAIWFMILMALSQILVLTTLVIFLRNEYHKPKVWLIPGIMIAVLVTLLLISKYDKDLNPVINIINIKDQQQKLVPYN